MTKFLDLVRKWKKDNNDKLIDWENLELSANKLDQTIRLELEKLKLERESSPISIAKEIGLLEYKIDQCKECKKNYNEMMEEAINTYESIGSPTKQFMSGKRVIITNPDQDILDLQNRQIYYPCDNHRQDVFQLFELKKLIK